MQEGYNCVLCQDGVEETIEHFFRVLGAASRWFALSIIWLDSITIFQRIISAKEASPHPFFMEVFMIGASCIWVGINRFIFDGIVPSLGS